HNAMEREMEKYASGLRECGIPEYMHGGIVRYLDHGVPPGSFLTAVISNDLREAFACADDVNGRLVRNYVMFFYSYAPAGSWGSPDAMDDWIKRLTSNPVEAA